MLPWGHLAVAYLCYSVLSRYRFGRVPSHAAVVALAIGSQFPDLLDKPLAWHLSVLPTGRTLAHSLLVLGPLVAVGYLLARRYDRGPLGAAFAIGALTHTLADALLTPWNAEISATFLLWPLVPAEPYDGAAPTITGLLTEAVTDPTPFGLVEFGIVAVALVVWWRDSFPVVRPLVETVRRPQ